jgi:hypothetical protein
MDAWWTRLVHGMFDVTSGNAVDNLRIELDDANRRNHVGSAFQGAIYSQVNKDLRQILGLAVADPWSRTYCGNGVLAACRTALWDAMSQAAADLQTEFSSANVADWKREVADEDIRHVAAGVTNVPAIHWINRPTFQQVVQVPNVDHFKCYKTRKVTGFVRRTVGLDDPFGPSVATLTRPDSLCNPADKNGEGTADPTAHLECYRVRDLPRGSRTVTVNNQFGAQALTLRRARTLCVPSEKDGVASPLALDFFKCYRATRGTPRFVRRTVSVADQFETKQTVVRRPDTVCTAVDVDGGGMRDATAALTCYRIRNAAGQTRFGGQQAATANAFGNETLSAVRARTLCVPSSLQ